MEKRIKEIEKRIIELVSTVTWLKFGNLIYLPIIFVFLLGSVFLFTNSFSYDVGITKHYNNGVLITRSIKQYHTVITPTNSNGGTFDISGYGLTTILNVNATVARNTATANDVPSIAIKSVSTSAITYNVMTANNATVAILGINVLSGSPQIFATNPSTLTIYLTITGY